MAKSSFTFVRSTKLPGARYSYSCFYSYFFVLLSLLMLLSSLLLMLLLLAAAAVVTVRLVAKPGLQETSLV